MDLTWVVIAGYAGVREALKSSRQHDRVDPLIPADGLHADLDSSILLNQTMDSLRFARDVRGTAAGHVRHCRAMERMISTAAGFLDRTWSPKPQLQEERAADAGRESLRSANGLIQGHSDPRGAGRLVN
jgi:hypothetical protein